MRLGLLAFGFAAPWLLAGLAFAAAPVIIHLLFRRKHRETRWAAMQFLLVAARQQRRWLQLEEILLLVLRTAIPLLAAIALAGPVWDLPPRQTAGAPTQRILVLDASLSMTALVEGQSAWERARQAAVGLVESSQAGDAWQIVRLAGRPPFAVISEPAVRVAPVLEELRALGPTEERATLAPALEMVKGLLDATPSHFRKEVYLFTDAQRTTWRPTAETEREPIRAAMKSIGEKARVIWWEAGAPAGNTAITDLQIAEPNLFTGETLEATVTLKRFGPEPATGRKLEWLVNGRLAATQQVDVPTGTDAAATFRYPIAVPGDVRIEARLPADDLPSDDRRVAVALVRDAVTALLVDGHPSGVPFANGTDLLRLALSPPITGSRSPTDPPRRIQPTVISDGELLSANLANYDVVFLCDVPLLTERDAEVVRQYVAQGGSLVVCLGPQVRAEAYNQAGYRDGKHWLPARVGDVVGDPRRRDQAFAFAGSDLDHPILSPFRGNPNTGFELTQTFAYQRCQPAPDRADVVLRFDTGDPAIIEAPYRRGRVVLITTAVDRSWGMWAVWGHSFVPMMHETVKYLLSFRVRDRNGLVGEPLGGGAAMSASLVVRRPQDDTDRVAVTTRDGVADWEFADTVRSGFYAVEPSSAGGAAVWFARNVDPRESDPAVLGPSEVREELLSGAPVSFDLPSERESMAVSGMADVTGAAAARWLLGAVLAFLIAEPFLAWNRLLGLGVVLGLTLAALAGVLGGATAAIAVVCAELVVAALWWHRENRRNSMT